MYVLNDCIMSKKFISNLSNKDFLNMKFRINNHFFDRWLERVNDKDDKTTIVSYIKKQASKNNIESDYNNFYVIDDEIVFVAKVNNGYIDLITVYGRISENPCLTNPRYLSECHRRYGKVSLTS